MTTSLTGRDLAEQAGHKIATDLMNTLLNSADQATALRAINQAITDAFGTGGGAITNAVAAGFSVGIVNVLERGIAAIRSDRAQT